MKKLMLGYAYASAGHKEEASGILWELESKLAGESRLALLSALLFTAMESNDRAFEQLERAYQIREPGLMFLRSPHGPTRCGRIARYDALVNRLGLG